MCALTSRSREKSMLVFVPLDWLSHAPCTLLVCIFSFSFLYVSYVVGLLGMVIRFREDLKSSTCTANLSRMNETNSAVLP